MPYHIRTEDSKIFNKPGLIHYFYECHLSNRPIDIDYDLEGRCAESLGLYRLLDQFCEVTGYDKKKVTISSGNMTEYHDHYNIVKRYNDWYEVPIMQQWVKDNNFKVGTDLKYHFGCFVGKSVWHRLWLSAWLYHNHRDKTLQTFHSTLFCHYTTRESHGIYDYLGLEKLNEFDCNIIPEVIKFLNDCPLTIPDDMLEMRNVEIPENFPCANQSETYPIEVPRNLTILSKYENIFVDIVAEPNVIGNCFMTSEKIWRPIISKRPFILLSNQHQLTNLKKLGFRTFNSWFNEDYDSYIAQDRIKHIQRTVNDISLWSKNELAEKLEDMYNTLDHNYQQFMNLSREDLKNKFGAI